MSLVNVRFSGSCRLSLLVAPLVLASTAAFAKVSPALDRFTFSLGGYYANADTHVSAGGTHGQFRANSNLERDLSLDVHKTVPRVKPDFLMGGNQGFSFD